MGWGKISVGFPWFNTMFVAVTPFLVLVMGIGPLTRWKHDEPGRLLRLLWVAFAIGLAVGAVAATGTDPAGRTCMWASVSASRAWLLATHLISLGDRLWHRGIQGLATDLAGKAAAITAWCWPTWAWPCSSSASPWSPTSAARPMCACHPGPRTRWPATASCSTASSHTWVRTTAPSAVISWSSRVIARSPSSTRKSAPTSPAGCP